MDERLTWHYAPREGFNISGGVLLVFLSNKYTHTQHTHMCVCVCVCVVCVVCVVVCGVYPIWALKVHGDNDIWPRKGETMIIFNNLGSCIALNLIFFQ